LSEALLTARTPFEVTPVTEGLPLAATLARAENLIVTAAGEIEELICLKEAGEFDTNCLRKIIVVVEELPLSPFVFHPRSKPRSDEGFERRIRGHAKNVTLLLISQVKQGRATRCAARWQAIAQFHVISCRETAIACLWCHWRSQRGRWRSREASV